MDKETKKLILNNIRDLLIEARKRASDMAGNAVFEEDEDELVIISDIISNAIKDFVHFLRDEGIERPLTTKTKHATTCYYGLE